MSAWRPTDAELYHVFVYPKTSRTKIASLSLDSATRMVEYRRKRKVPLEYRDLPMSNEEIAQAILNYARGAAATVTCPACNAPNPWASRFCCKCGASLETAKAPPVVRSGPPRGSMPAEIPSKSSTGRTLLIIGAVLVGGIVLFCVILMTFGQLIAPDEAQGTALAVTTRTLPGETPKPTEIPLPTATPRPTAPPFAVIQAYVEAMTEAQWKQYLPTLAGQRVENWTGWVVEVDEKLSGRYEVWVDMDEPGLFSTQDVYIPVGKDLALALMKGQRVRFSGTIERASELLGSLSITLADDATLQSAE